VDAFLQGCKNIVVLDSLNNLTTEKADVLIPVATFAEGDGNLVNNEGRAQRFFQVFIPKNKYITESWRWIWKMKAQQAGGENGKEHHPEELLRKIEAALPQFTGLSKIAPPHDFRIHGQLIPREPHRYSGRTAMLADINVSEPKPLQDDDSPLTYTIEGYPGIPPSTTIPFFWSPGWNSIQSVNKYQQEVGGALRGGDPGIRLINEKPGSAPVFFQYIADPFIPKQKKWFVLPQYHVFGSAELAAYSPGIRELSPKPYIKLSKKDAEELGVNDGSNVSIRIYEREYSFPVIIQNELSAGIVLVPTGLDGMAAMSWGNWITMEKAN